MARRIIAVLAGVAALSLVVDLAMATGSQEEDTAAVRAADLEWPLPPGERIYGSIDGKRMWQYVVEQAEISRRYRSAGHPQFWGRIIGTSGDAEDARWLAGHFSRIGLSDVHIQPLDLLPQWFPQSWQVTASGAGASAVLASAQPVYRSPGTQSSGLDLPAVYLGEGTPADFLGRDVRGKAVIIASVYPPGFCPQCPAARSQQDPLRLAASKGAAALFYAYTALPGNVRYQSYPTGTDVPTFTLGRDDGQTLEELIARAPPGEPPHLKIRLDVQMVPNLKTALVWGTLPGQTDETIYVIAHRDGWFDAAGDNASGVASMLGLADYFAGLGKRHRRRTLVFIGIDGHHDSGPGAAVGDRWLVEHRNALFSKTALMINDEHVSDALTEQFQGKLGLTNIPAATSWYAGGPARPQLEKIVADAFHTFGVSAWRDPSAKPPAGDITRFTDFLPGLEYQSNDFIFFHTDANTPETVPWTGLEAITRADAYIIDEVNKLDLKDLQPLSRRDP